MNRTFYIAGVQFRTGLKEVGADLKAGMELDLVPEPENEYDPNAVAIHHEGTHLGYVPKKFSSDVSAILEIDELVCTITKVDMSLKPWEQCEVTVKQKEE